MPLYAILFHSLVLKVRSRWAIRFAVGTYCNVMLTFKNDLCQGVGVHPSIKFDRREVLLAPTPPGVPQKVSFFVINNGFDNLDLQYDIAADSKHLPINVSFPNGTMLNVVRQVSAWVRIAVNFAVLVRLTVPLVVETEDTRGTCSFA